MCYRRYYTALCSYIRVAIKNTLFDLPQARHTISRNRQGSSDVGTRDGSKLCKRR